MNSGVSPENGPQDRPDRLKEYAGLLYDVASLITEIEADEEHGEHREHVFTFDLLGEHFVEIPSEVTDLIKDVDQINVTLSKDRASVQEAISLSIDFISKNAMLTVSRSHEGEVTFNNDTYFDTSYHYQPDTVTVLDVLADAKQQMNNEINEDFDGRLTSVDKISTEKINALIMSLIYPDKERGYEMFSDANFLSIEAFDSLIDSFTLSALSQNNSLGHRFNSNDVDFSYFKEGNDNISFELQYPDKDLSRVITARSNMDTDFRIQFTTIENTGKNPFSPDAAPTFDLPQSTAYHPTPEELQYLRSILQTEIAALNPTSIELVDTEVAGGVEPEQALIDQKKVYFSKLHVQAVLDKLGFDAPDAGTA